MYILEGSVMLLLLLFSFREQVRHFMNSNKSLIFIYFDFGFCYFGMVVVVVLVDNHSIKHETANTHKMASFL